MKTQFLNSRVRRLDWAGILEETHLDTSTSAQYAHVTGTLTLSMSIDGETYDIRLHLLEGKLHRTTGPAVEVNGSSERVHYLGGMRLSEDEFYAASATLDAIGAR